MDYNLVMVKNKDGFTIVELLIVIVIIGILASITIVAFNGIQNRAYNNSVIADLRNNAQSLAVYFADKGTYPNSQLQLVNESAVSADPRLNILASKSAYDTSRLNFIYCYGGGQQYAIIAASKGGANYYISSASSTPQTLSSFPASQASACPLALGPSFVAGEWGHNAGTWQTNWVK